MENNMKNRIKKAKMTAGQKIKQAGHWVKDHWVQLTLGALAIGGGAYVYAKHRGNGNECQVGSQMDYTPEYEPDEFDSDEIKQAIDEAWDACDHGPYEGPTE